MVFSVTEEPLLSIKKFLLLPLKTCIFFYDTDSEIDSDTECEMVDIKQARENHPGQKSSSSQAKGKHFEKLLHISLYV